MKKNLLLSLCVASVAGGLSPVYGSGNAVGDFCRKFAASQRIGKPEIMSWRHTAPSAVSNASGRVMRSAAAGPLWRAKTEEISIWDAEEWLPVEKYESEYNAAGLVTVQINTDFEFYDHVRETNEYDSNNMLVKSLTEAAEDGGEYRNSQLTERSYDEILTSLITVNSQWLWMGDDWYKSGNNYHRNITRDDAGNITLVEIATLYQGEYDPTQRLYVTYGDDGKASELLFSVLTIDSGSSDFVWKEDVRYTDIVWEETDGQIYDIDLLMTGANRIKSAVLHTDDIMLNLNVSYDYPAGDGLTADYYAELTASDSGYEMKSTGMLVTLDDNESYRLVTEYTESYGEDELLRETTTEECIYDDYGIATLYEMRFSDGEMEEIEARDVTKVEYDAQYGYPLVSEMSSYDYESGEMYNWVRIVYGDYVDAADVDAVESVGEDAGSDPVYYNLQGVRVESSHLLPGIYVRHAGGKSSKVIVK